MKKILHLSITSEIGGGPEHIFQLIKGLSPQFQSYVACPNTGLYYKKFLDLTSNRVTILPHRKFSVLSLLSIYRYIKANKIELLHAHGRGAGFYCRLISIFIHIPVIHTPHGINQKIEKGFINGCYIKFEKLFSFLITAIIYVSKTEFDYGRKLDLWPNVPAKIINNGTKIISSKEKHEMRELKRKQLNWTDEKVIITASRFDFQKNTLEFCKIAAKLPDIIFVILGDGEEKKQCEIYCSSLLIKNVLFLGNVSNPLDYFAAADIYLSTSRWEGLSMAMLESMAVGLPIVATNVIGNIDLVKENENGFVYSLGNVDEAAGYLSSIFDGPNYGKLSMGAMNFHNNNFSSESMCNKTSLLYNYILKNK